MSMNGGFRTISSRALEALRANPHLSNSILDFGSPDAPGAPGIPLSADISAMLKGMPAEMAEQLKGQIGATLSRRFGGEGTRDREAEDEIAALGLTPSDFGQPISIQKAWHGLHFLLAGTTWEPSEGAGSAVLGGSEIGDDLGYGPLRALADSQVAVIAGALESITPTELAGKYQIDTMEAQEIYPGGWSDTENLAWLVEAFQEVRDYFLRAREDRMAMLLYIT